MTWARPEKCKMLKISSRSTNEDNDRMEPHLDGGKGRGGVDHAHYCKVQGDFSFGSLPCHDKHTLENGTTPQYQLSHII